MSKGRDKGKKEKKKPKATLSTVIERRIQKMAEDWAKYKDQEVLDLWHRSGPQKEV